MDAETGCSGARIVVTIRYAHVCAWDASVIENLSVLARIGTWDTEAMDDGTPIKELLRYQGEFLAYLMAITRDFNAAEEVFQNAAVVIIEGATAGEPIRNFRAWAKEIVRRQALYYLRKQGQQERRRRAIDPDLFEAISEAFLEEDEGPGIEVKALRQCLEKVPAAPCPTCRAAPFQTGLACCKSSMRCVLVSGPRKAKLIP